MKGRFETVVYSVANPPLMHGRCYGSVVRADTAEAARVREIAVALVLRNPRVGAQVTSWF